MNIEEWKKELTERIKSVIDVYESLASHITDLEDIEGDFDEDEVGAFILIKLTKMNKTIERIAEI